MARKRTISAPSYYPGNIEEARKQFRRRFRLRVAVGFTVWMATLVTMLLIIWLALPALEGMM